ncbi:SubName: Full=Related to glutathione S-transferase {ECO:0000313/EMBL:CCA75056.1} [Serendipita indica DSM 11827]|nr:SubName: Full=Related to glutathione S-transferase {ECO:0000313/EMBL:CCA75056.1} [Serendipita indica DSM 11827]
MDNTDKPSTGLVLHHLENSRSQRVLWLLEELEIPYTIKHYKRTKEQLAPRELRDIHPLGKSPVITDGDVTVAESGAIIEYLIEKYGNGRFEPPPTQEAKLQNRYYTHFGEGTLMPYLVNLHIFNIVPNRMPWFMRWFTRLIFGALQKRLIVPNLGAASKLKNLNKFSADFVMLFPLEAFPLALGEKNVGPKTKAWVEMAHKRPAYIRALEKGGNYVYAKL